MILKTIRNCIADLPCISFEQYFTQYVFDIQDMNIEEEVKFMITNNFLNTASLYGAIKQDEDKLSW